MAEKMLSAADDGAPGTITAFLKKFLSGPAEHGEVKDVFQNLAELGGKQSSFKGMANTAAALDLARWVPGGSGLAGAVMTGVRTAVTAGAGALGGPVAAAATAAASSPRANLQVLKAMTMVKGAVRKLPDAERLMLLKNPVLFQATFGEALQTAGAIKRDVNEIVTRGTGVNPDAK